MMLARVEDSALPSPEPPAEPRRTSFRAVYDEHFDFVWRFAANRGVPPPALEDVAQEVFLVVARELPRFEGRSALRSWIFGIARNVIHNYRRKRGNQAAGEPLDDDEHYAIDAKGPEDLLEQKSAGELLESILSKMSELQREAFICCELEGLSAAESAQALGVNEHTLKSRLHEARKVFNAFSARLHAQRAWSGKEGGGE